MPATYNPSAIATDLISYARTRFHDVAQLEGDGPGYTVGRPLLLDEEYQGFIDRCGAQEGLAQASEALGAQYAQKVAKYAQAGGIAIEWPKRPEFYAALANTIRKFGIDSSSNGIYGWSCPAPTPENDERLALL